jgi:Zn-dependent protease
MQPGDIFQIVVLIFSVVLHEVAHGYMANYLGDPTARFQGRLTLNPIKHIDPLGSVFLPLILKLTGSPILIGYAKPVPYNPYNLRGRWGEALVAFAGPGTNILLALIFGLSIRFFGGMLEPELVAAFTVIVFINLLLALFNLIPVPPLDGSKILSEILPGGLGRAYGQFRTMFEQLGVLTGTLIILVLFYFFAPYFGAVLGSLFALLTGLPF